MDAVEVYKLVLSGKLKRFPNGYWQNPEAKDNAIKCVRFLLKDYLNLSHQEIKDSNLGKIIRGYRLAAILSSRNFDNVLEIVMLAFPGDFKPWEFKKAGHGHWNSRENRIEAIKWLVDQVLLKEDFKAISKQTFKEYGLSGLLATYDGSPFAAIEDAFQGEGIAWRLSQQVPTDYWDDSSNIARAIRWVIEKKLNLDEEDIKELFTIKLLTSNGLAGLYDATRKEAHEYLEIAYPGRIKPWQLRYSSQNYWDSEEKVINAVKWLIEKELVFDSDDVKEKLSREHFEQHGMNFILRKYKGAFELLNMAYPGMYKRTDLKNFDYTRRLNG